MTSALHRQRLLGVFGSLLGLTAVGCGPDVREGFEASYCADGQPNLVGDLKPAEAVDYVALYEAYAGDDGEPTALLIDETGDACVDGGEECLAAVSTAPPDIAGDPFWLVDYLVTTQGAEVKKLLTAEEVRAFVGTVDTPGEAALLVQFSGYDLDCTDNNIAQEEGGYLVYAETGTGCGEGVDGHQIFVSTTGELTVRQSQQVDAGDPGCSIGRLPCGLASWQRTEGTDVGAFYARVAQLEAASVAAFEQLLRELEAHGAPQALRESARAAVAQETRHARLTTAIARKYGRSPQPPVVAPMRERGLEEIALDNAVEGLVRETYGALVAHHQAEHAADPFIRAVARVIADDETSHAAFSWELHEWILSRLTPTERLRVEAARQSALLALGPRLCADLSPEVQHLAGMPSAARARSLFAGLASALSLS